MAKIKKLTPNILKRIIKEEKLKLRKSKKNNPSIDKYLNEFTRLSLQEAKAIKVAKKIKAKKELIIRRLKRR